MSDNFGAKVGKMKSNELFYVTANAGKFIEVKDYLQRHAPHLNIKQIAMDLDEKQSNDQREIALCKAKQAFAKIAKPLLVDDSGIYFDQYNNFPGTMTKFVYEGIGLAGILKLISDDARATFLLHMVYIDSDHSFEVFEGRCAGRIVAPCDLMAHRDLPYDDIFIPNGANKTKAQMRGTPEIEQYAYRLKALEKFLKWFGQY